MNWQPIETAPKDGSMVLAYPSSLGHVCMTGWVVRCCPYHGGYWDTGGDFTHWMPLPPPPTAEQITTTARDGQKGHES